MCSPGHRVSSWAFPPETPNALLQEDPYFTWILRESRRFEHFGSRLTRHSPGPPSPTPLLPSATGQESSPVTAAQALEHRAWGSQDRYAGLKALYRHCREAVLGLLPSLSRPQFLHLQSGRLLEAGTELICKESSAQCPVPMTLKWCQLSSLQSRRAALQPSLGFLSPSHSNRSGCRPETLVTSHTHLGEFH